MLIYTRLHVSAKTGYPQTLQSTFQAKIDHISVCTYMMYVLPEMFFIRPEDSQF
jgi:hypothetical protein